MKGECDILELFEAHARGEEQLETIVGRVLMFLVAQEPLNSNFQGLIEARRRFPDAFRKTMDVVCRQLEVPKGLTPLLRLYLGTRDIVIQSHLADVREEAVRKSDWDVLEEIAEAGLTEELAKLAKRRRLAW